MRIDPDQEDSLTSGIVSNARSRDVHDLIQRIGSTWRYGFNRCPRGRDLTHTFVPKAGYRPPIRDARPRRQDRSIAIFGSDAPSRVAMVALGWRFHPLQGSRASSSRIIVSTRSHRAADPAPI